MRKELTYSLLTLAAVPGAANAAAVNVDAPQQLVSTNWSGDPTVSEGTVLVTAGASISQSVGTLLPGKYVVKIDKLVSTDCALNVNFGGQTKSIAAASTTATLEFDLTSEQEVTITISSAEAKSFQVTDVTLQLKYDFLASYTTFNDALVKVTSLINQIQAGYAQAIDGQNDLLAEAQAIQKKIDEIKAANDDPTAAGNYNNVYKKYALYGDDATNAIMAEIDALRAKGAKAVNDWYVNDLNTKADALYTAATADVQKIVKSFYDGIKAEITSFKNNLVVDDKEYKALLAKIDNGNDADNKDLKDKIRVAKDTADNNDGAYNDVKDYINGTGAYTTQWASTDKSAYGYYADINAQLMTLFAADRYKNILAAAQKELSLDLQKVTQVEKDNESYHDAIQSVAHQAELKTAVDAAVAAMQTVVAKYTTTKNQLDAADGQYNTINGSLNTAKTTHAVGLTVSQIASKLSAANAAVQAVKDAIEAANVTTDQGKIDETMAALDLTALVAAANTAITNLNTTAAPYTAHQQAIAAANTKKANLDTEWNTKKTKAAGYKYDSDLVSNYFAATISNIETKITNLQNALNKANKTDGSTGAGKWENGVYTYNTTFYASTYDTDANTIKSLYNAYESYAKDAQDNYNRVVNSKNPDGSATVADGLVKLQAALDAADAKVKDLAIYNDITYNYAQKVVDIQAKIDAVYAKITGAKALKDANHYNVMAGVSDVTVGSKTYPKVELDATIATDIAAIEASYADDNTTLETTLKAAMLAATASSYNDLVDDINSLDGDAVKYGKSYTAIDKGRTDIKTEEATLLFGLDKSAAATAINAANSEELAEIQANIATIREKLDELLAVAKQAAELVKANQDAQAELIKAIYDGAPGANQAGNLDKYFADKITNDALVNNATALGVGTNIPTAVTKVNKEMNIDIPAAIAALKAKVGTGNDSGTDRMAETLADNKATHLQTIADLKARIDKALADAKACTANYNKYQEFVTATTGKIDVALAALNTAVGKANTADAANSDYADKAFVNSQKLKITAATTGVQALALTYYKNSTIVDRASQLEATLKEVTDFAAGLEATAKANKKAYDDLQAEWNVVKTLWNTVSTDIAKYDESSKREGFQEELKAELDKLNKNQTDYQANYGAIALPNNDRVAEQAAIKSAINDIKARSLDPEKYNANIKADNDHMMEVIKALVAEAGREYDVDTDTLKMFKNPTSDVLTTSLATVTTQYDTFNDKLYQYATIGTATVKSTFVEVVNDKYQKAAAEYAATASPVVFDKDSAWVNTIRTDIQNLVTARENFMTAIRAAIASETASTIAGYQTQIDNVIAQLEALNGYKAKINNATAKAAVKTQSDNLAAAKDAVAAGLIPEIDAAFEALKNLTSDLAAAKFAAMRTKLDADITAAEAYVEEGRAYLADDAENLSTFNSEAYNVKNARWYYNWYNTAASLTDALYNQIQNLIVEFQTGGNNTYEQIKANNTAWPTIQGYVTSAQKYLDDAIAGIAEYAAAGELQQKYLGVDNTQTDWIQKKINDAYDLYLGMYENGTLKASDATAAKNLLDANKTIQNQVKVYVATNNNTSALYTLEKAILTDNIAELEAEYNKYAAGDLTDIDAANAEKAIIEAIKKDFNTAGTSNTAAKLLAIQKRVAEEMTKLLNANYGEGVSNDAVKAELEAELAKLEGTVGTYTDEELAYDADLGNKDLTDEVEQLNAAIADIKAEMADKADNLYYYQEDISNKIAAAQKLADAIKTQAEANKASIAADKAAFENAYKGLLQTNAKSIQRMNYAIEDAEWFMNNNTAETAKAAAFQHKLDQLTEQVSDMQETINASKEAGVKQTSAAFTTLSTKVQNLYDEIRESLYDLENTAADRELNAQAADLQAQLDAITYNPDDYTLKDQKDMANLKKQIDEAINGVKNAAGEVTTDGLVQDIAKAKMEDYELNTSYNPVKPSTSTDATTSFEYLRNNGKQYNWGGKVNTIQQDIDDLKAKIEDLTIEPEEPEVVPGDITGTGTVTMGDFTQFSNDLLAGNLPTAGDANFDAYDANGDGIVTIADLQAILNLANGLNADGSLPSAARVKDNVSIEGTLNAMTQTRNGVTRLAIVLDANAEFTAFQMDVMLPAGATIVGESLGESTQGVQLLSNDLANGAHRILGISTNGNITNGNVLYIDVEGNGQVDFSNIHFTTAQAQSVSFTIGGTTGINGLTADQQQTENFDLSGRLANSWQKGVNIVRDAYGNVKKVFKK
ncbi:MAG: hypothetical protein IJ570_08370 [Prevotella sp.]|nr:hypothetical protein [Prevotella sp.]